MNYAPQPAQFSSTRSLPRVPTYALTATYPAASRIRLSKMERFNPFNRPLSAFQRTRTPAESRCKSKKSYQKLIQIHLQHTHHDSAFVGTGLPLVSRTAALTPCYPWVVSHIVPKLVVFNRSQLTYIRIHNLHIRTKPVSIDQSTYPNSIGFHLQHSHGDPACFSQFESHHLLRHLYPTWTAYKTRNPAGLPHFASQKGFFSEWAHHSSAFAWPHSRIYSHLQPLTVYGHQHLHTYPPFKGGKCNSGSGWRVNRALIKQKKGPRQGKSRIWTWTR
jgi:hypothetical protein